MNRARLNHILIPASHEGRQRVRASLLGRLLAPFGWMYGALTEEGRALSVLLLFVGTAALDVAATPIYLLWCGLAAVMAGSLVGRLTLRLSKLRVQVRVGARVSVAQPLTMDVVLHNDGSEDLHALRISGPFLPWDGAWLKRPPAVRCIPAGGRLQLTTEVRFVQRGPHHLDRFAVGALMPLGLAIGPKVRSDSVRFLVVPRIAQVQRVTLPGGAGAAQAAGLMLGHRYGDARELYGVRPYRRGDAVRDLHPRTWARTGKPHVREYIQEQFIRLAVVVDTSAAEVGERGFEGLLSLSAGVVAQLLRGDASVTLLAVGDSLRPFSRGRVGGDLNEALDMLAEAEPAAAVSDADWLARLTPYLSQLSGVIVITATARSGLADALGRAGFSSRIIRLHNDLPRGLRRIPRATPQETRATLVALSEVEKDHRLWL